MSATSTARRYGPDYGPVIFGCAGCPPLDVRWNKLTGALVIEVRGDPSAACLVDRAVAPAVLVGLAAAHRRGACGKRCATFSTHSASARHGWRQRATFTGAGG